MSRVWLIASHPPASGNHAGTVEGGGPSGRHSCRQHLPGESMLGSLAFSLPGIRRAFVCCSFLLDIQFMLTASHEGHATQSQTLFPFVFLCHTNAFLDPPPLADQMAGGNCSFCLLEP